MQKWLFGTIILVHHDIYTKNVILSGSKCFYDWMTIYLNDFFSTLGFIVCYTNDLSNRGIVFNLKYRIIPMLLFHAQMIISFQLLQYFLTCSSIVIVFLEMSLQSDVKYDVHNMNSFTSTYVPTFQKTYIW